MADRTKVEPGKRDIFISYSSRDREIARKLKQSVDSLQYTAFFDEVALPGSPEWDRDISRNLGSCRIVLFYRTENSVASEWCARELRLAEQKHKIIVPVVNRSKQNCPPDSEAMEALLVNRQNTFIDELEPPSVIRENLRQTLENCIGKGTGTFGEMSDILNDLLRQTAAAMNMASQEQGHDREEKSRGSLIQYAYDDEDGAQFYRELTFGNLTAVFRMVCRKGGPPRKWNCGGKNKRCGECPIKELCPKTQSCYVIDTYVQILKGSTKKCDIGPFREALKDLEIGSSKLKLKDCPSKEELLFVRKPLNELSYFDDKDGKKKSESNAFSAVLSLISEAWEMFSEIDRALQGLQKRADSWNEFPDHFSEDKELNGDYEIYRDGLIFSLIPRDSSGKKLDPKELGMYDSIKIEKPDPEELGIYDSIEIERPNVIRIRFDSFFSDARSDARHEIRFERFETNQRTTSELLLSSPFLKGPSLSLLEGGAPEPQDAVLPKKQDPDSGGERLMVAIRKKVKNLMAVKVEFRKTWGEEEKIREKFQALIGDLGASFCNWNLQFMQIRLRKMHHLRQTFCRDHGLPLRHLRRRHERRPLRQMRRPVCPCTSLSLPDLCNKVQGQMHQVRPAHLSVFCRF